eukprot:1242893-Pyramimonas_sp.AAC.1
MEELRLEACSRTQHLRPLAVSWRVSRSSLLAARWQRAHARPMLRQDCQRYCWRLQRAHFYARCCWHRAHFYAQRHLQKAPVPGKEHFYSHQAS